MTEPNQAEESIKHSINKNGFPGKIVRLPFKPVYDACKKHGTNLSDVLDNLQEQQIFGKIIGNHVEFRSREKIDLKSPDPSSDDDFSWIKGAAGNMKGFQDAAKEAMGKVTPDQMQEIRKSIESMSDEEKMNIMKMFSQRFDPSK
jgi:hypothetical protein